MTETAWRPDVAKISIRPVQHFASGTRCTHVTWAAVLVLDDGTEETCGHEGHRSVQAATACGRKASRA